MKKQNFFMLLTQHILGKTPLDYNKTPFLMDSSTDDPLNPN